MTQDAIPSLETIAKNLSFRFPKVDSLEAAFGFMEDNLSLIPLSDGDKNTVTANVLGPKGQSLVHYNIYVDELPNERNIQLGEKMLQEATRGGFKIDFNKIEQDIASVLTYELRNITNGSVFSTTVSNLIYAFGQMAFTAGLGHTMQLSRLWMIGKRGYGLQESETAPTRKILGYSRPIKGASNLLGNLQEVFNKDEFYIKLAELDNSPEKLAKMIGLARAAGISIVPEHLVKLGYEQIIQGKQPVYGINLIKTGQNLGAEIIPEIQTVLTRYERIHTK